VFRDHFEREVEQLWSRIAGVADAHPRVAPELARNAHSSLTRLVQATAYFFAAVRSRLDDDMPELVHPLVAQALPGALTGMPSVTIVQFTKRTAEGGTLAAAGARVLQQARGQRPVSFVTRWDAQLAPLSVVDARAERRTGEQAAVELTMRLHAPSADTPTTLLRLHVDLGEDGASADLVYDLLSSTTPIRVRALDARGATLNVLPLEGERFRRSVWSEAASIAPGRDEAFPSSALLRAWYCFPTAFCFVDLELPRTLWAALPLGTQSLRLEIDLPRGAAAPARLTAAGVRLGCAPAVNAFEATTTPIALENRPVRAELTLPGRDDDRPWILDVLRARGEPRGPSPSPRLIPSWEDADSDRALRDDAVSYRLFRRARPYGDEPLIELSFASPAGHSVAPPYASVTADVLAYDGTRAGGLLPGELVREGDLLEARNVTTTTRALPPAFDRELPWRLNAYARAPVDRLARAEAVAAFLALHDLPRLHLERRAGALRLRHPGVRDVVQRHCSRLEHGELQHGDDLTIAIALSAFGGRGAASVLGEIIARTFAERASLLRYTRTRVVGEGFLFDGGDRNGERLPAPFG
jgi:type VI secretion system protein ImpG